MNDYNIELDIIFNDPEWYDYDRDPDRFETMDDEEDEA